MASGSSRLRASSRLFPARAACSIEDSNGFCVVLLKVFCPVSFEMASSPRVPAKKYPWSGARRMALANPPRFQISSSSSSDSPSRNALETTCESTAMVSMARIRRMWVPLSPLPVASPRAASARIAVFNRASDMNRKNIFPITFALFSTMLF